MKVLARSSQQVGNAIRRARKELGWSQGALAARTGLRQETISQIENGTRSARVDSLFSLLAALDLELQIAPRSKLDLERALDAA